MVVTVVKYLREAWSVNVKTIINTSNISMAFRVLIENACAETEAIDLLKNGHVIAVPTDTVYGLACNATNVDAINKLYQIKARNENKPVAICIGNVSDVQKWALVEHLPDGLLTSLLPGPVTLVLNCANKLHSSLSFHGKVGIRIPNYLFIQNIAKGLNGPIALTSANKSGEPSSVVVEEFKELWSEISAVFDGGLLGGAVGSENSASTVVDISRPGYYKVLRTGIAGRETSSIIESFGLHAAVL